jgi:hypothetical protein
VNQSRTALALLVAAIVAGIAWVTLHSLDTQHASAAKPIVSADEGQPSAGELEAPKAERALSIAPLTERARSGTSEEAAPDTRAPSESLLLYGFIRPAASREQFVDEVSVQLMNSFGERQMGKSGADGAYSFSGLAPGHYWVGSWSPRNGAVHVQVDLDANVPEKRLDLQLVLGSRPELLVKVIGRDHEPITDLHVCAVATREQPGEWLDEFDGTSNPYGVGRFAWAGTTFESAIPSGYIGRLELDSEPPVFVSIVQYQRTIATQRAEPGQTEVVFEFDRNSPLVQPASVRFRLVDAETHALVEKPTVMLNSGGMRPLKSQEDVFRADHLEPGWYEIKVHAKGYASPDYRIRIEPGSENDLGDLALESGLWISGKVVDGTGQGVSTSLRFDKYDREHGAARVLGSIYTVRSNNDGSFKIEGLSRRAYLLTVMSGSDEPWAQCSKVFDASAGPVENARFELVHGVTLALRRSEMTAPWVRARVLDATGFMVVSRRLTEPEPVTVRLAPGNYVIEVRTGDEGEPKRIPITIESQPMALAIP